MSVQWACKKYNFSYTWNIAFTYNRQLFFEINRRLYFLLYVKYNSAFSTDSICDISFVVL